MRSYRSGLEMNSRLDNALLCCLILLLLLMLTLTIAWGRDNGQWQNADPRLREWFKSQRNPSTGQSCCSEADGTFAEEDIRDGKYWVRWWGHDWMPVPDGSIIRPNPHGSPVVWSVDRLGRNGTETTIRCFAPGGGV